jgi:hypothetical protein
LERSTPAGWISHPKIEFVSAQKQTWKKQRAIHKGRAMQNIAQSALVYQICPPVESEDMRGPGPGNPTKVTIPGKQVQKSLPGTPVSTPILDRNKLIGKYGVARDDLAPSKFIQNCKCNTRPHLLLGNVTVSQLQSFFLRAILKGLENIPKEVRSVKPYYL